jgi:hypothetical protein
MANVLESWGDSCEAEEQLTKSLHDVVVLAVDRSRTAYPEPEPEPEPGL